jgi:hypothetical protein
MPQIVPLRAAQDEYVFKTGVFMQRDTTARTKPKKSRGRPTPWKTVNPMNIHPGLKSCPLKLVFTVGELQKIWENPLAGFPMERLDGEERWSGAHWLRDRLPRMAV